MAGLGYFKVFLKLIWVGTPDDFNFIFIDFADIPEAPRLSQAMAATGSCYVVYLLFLYPGFVFRIFKHRSRGLGTKLQMSFFSN